MKTKLITALRTAAKALEDGTFPYNWNAPHSCNCGILACTITNRSSISIGLDLAKIPIPSDEGHPNKTWRRILQYHCPVTGLSENQIVRSMQQAGLTAKDMVELEDLSNPEVCRRAGFEMAEFDGNGSKTSVGMFDVTRPKTFWQKVLRRPAIKETKVLSRRTHKESTIKYMRAWADLLTEQGREDHVETPEELRQSPDSIETTK